MSTCCPTKPPSLSFSFSFYRFCIFLVWGHACKSSFQRLFLGCTKKKCLHSCTCSSTHTSSPVCGQPHMLSCLNQCDILHTANAELQSVAAREVHCSAELSSCLFQFWSRRRCLYHHVEVERSSTIWLLTARLAKATIDTFDKWGSLPLATTWKSYKFLRLWFCYV